MNNIAKARNNLYYVSTECDRLADAMYGAVDTDTGEITDKDRFNEIQQAMYELQGEMPDKIAQAACVWLEGKSELERIDGALKRLQAIKAQTSTGLDLLRVAMDGACKKNELELIERTVNGVPVKVSYRKSERVEIDNIADIPDDCKRIKIEPDKTAIKQAIKQGREISGAHIEQGSNLQIK